MKRLWMLWKKVELDSDDIERICELFDEMDIDIKDEEVRRIGMMES